MVIQVGKWQNARSDFTLRNGRASSKKGDLVTAMQLIVVMKKSELFTRGQHGLNMQLAMIEGMIEGGTHWSTVEAELLSFVAVDERTRRLADYHVATVVLALVRVGDLEAARRALQVLPTKWVKEKCLEFICRGADRGVICVNN